MTMLEPTKYLLRKDPSNFILQVFSSKLSFNNISFLHCQYPEDKILRLKRFLVIFCYGKKLNLYIKTLRLKLRETSIISIHICSGLVKFQLLLAVLSVVLIKLNTLGSQLIEKIKQKMFSLYLTRYAVQNITKKVPAYFFPLFRSDEVCFTQKSFQLI